MFYSCQKNNRQQQQLTLIEISTDELKITKELLLYIKSRKDKRAGHIAAVIIYI